MAGNDIRAGRAFVELFVKNANFLRGLNAAGEQFRDFGKRLMAGGAAVGGVMAGLAATFTQAGTELAKLSAQTGASVENLSRMKFAAQQMKIDPDDLTGAIEELNIRLGETIRDGIGPAAEALQQLGLDANQLADMPLPERFGMIADALNRIDNQATRGFLADEIFGGDAFKILPLLRQGSEGIRALADESDRLGATLSGEQVANAQKLGAAWADLTGMARATAVQLGAALAPALIRLSEILLPQIEQVAMFVQQNAAMINVIAGLAAAAVAAGAVFIGLGAALTAVSFAATAILSPLGLVAVGIAAAAAGAYRFSDSLRDLAEAAPAITGPLKAAFDGLKDTWAGFVDAIKSGDLNLAAEIAWAGLDLVWQRGTANLREYWITAKYFAMETWQSFKTELASLFVDLFAGAQIAWANTVAFIQSTWNTLTTTLFNAWNDAQLGIGEFIIAAAEKSGAVSSEFAGVWRETLNSELQGRIDQRSGEAADRAAEIEANLRSQLAQIQGDAAGAIATLEADRTRALAALDSASEGERLAAAERLLEAERRLAELRTQAAAEEQQAAESTAAATDAAGPDGVASKTAGEVIGTFSAAALSRLGGNLGNDDVATNTREMRRELIEQTRELRKNRVAAERFVDVAEGLMVRFT